MVTQHGQPGIPGPGCQAAPHRLWPQSAPKAIGVGGGGGEVAEAELLRNPSGYGREVCAKEAAILLFLEL